MLKIIKNIFINIIFLYKNFFHWNSHKILIIIPLFIWSIISNTFGLQIISTIGFILILSFIQLQLANLNINYINGKKIKIKENYYLNVKLFLKSSIIIFVILGIILLNFGIFILFSYITFLLFGGDGNSINNFLSNNNFSIFSITVLIFFIIFIISSFYLIYRLIFSYNILIENTKYSALKSIKKSFLITKSIKKFIKFIFINLILIIIFIPTLYVKSMIDFNEKNIKYYTYLKNKKAIKKPFIKNDKIDEFYIYKNLELKYKEYSYKELVGKSRFIYIIQILYTIFSFLFIYGILDLTYASFYKKNLKKGKY